MTDAEHDALMIFPKLARFVIAMLVYLEWLRLQRILRQTRMTYIQSPSDPDPKAIADHPLGSIENFLQHQRNLLNLANWDLEDLQELADKVEKGSES